MPTKKELIKELRDISDNWNEMNLNDDVSEYPFNESFDELIYDINSKSFEYVKEVHTKITNWIKTL